MNVLEVNDVSIRYITGDFKDIGLKEYVMKRLKGDYHVTEFWADRNISFTLEKGEMLGIIGTNGAGKSTLLKAVSGIMEPTTGYVKREGNIAALLELASGFDGELTVRENAYLRGAMLGYTRKFMDEKYDDIIAFAELQDFQDRPFRQLSSGMKSRLAFSIASLVQPDLLILDEVLSVGDGAFRNKSEAKMKEIIAGGAATILVSHSIEQVRQLCTKVLWLDHGKQIILSDDVEGVCNLYQRFLDKEISIKDAINQSSCSTVDKRAVAQQEYSEVGSQKKQDVYKGTVKAMRRKVNISTTALFALVAILTVQIVLITYYGQQKAGYHIDEMYTFELANLPDGFLVRQKDLCENWKPGSYYIDALTVDDNERFDYSLPYHNQETDVHPPLYYYVIHTISSFFPRQFSKWMGIIPNMVFCLLATVLLFLVSKRISGSDGLSLITTGMWSLSVGATNTAIFIRMYAMLTVLTLLLTLIHLQALEEVQKEHLSARTLFMLLLCTTCGILTQYYYLIFCFFLCGLFFLYLAFKRKWEVLWRYVGVEFGAIILSIAYFPKMLYHIFDGYRGREAFENAGAPQLYQDHLKTITSVISRELCNGWIKELILLIVVVWVLYALNQKLFHFKVASDSENKGLKLSWKFEFTRVSEYFISMQTLLTVSIVAISSGYILMVALIAPYQVNRYYMCIYPFVVMAMVHVVYALVDRLAKNSAALKAGITVLIVVVTILGYKMQGVDYLYRWRAIRTEDLKPYYGLPAIILNSDNEIAPDILMTEHENFSAVYRCKAGSFDGLANAAATMDLSNGFLLYINELEDLGEEKLFEEIQPYLKVEDHKLVTSISGAVYYCSLEVTE